MRRFVAMSCVRDGSCPTRRNGASRESQIRFTRRTNVFFGTTRMWASRGTKGLGAGGAAAEPQPPRAIAAIRTGKVRLTPRLIDAPAGALEFAKRLFGG